MNFKEKYVVIVKRALTKNAIDYKVSNRARMSSEFIEFISCLTETKTVGTKFEIGSILLYLYKLKLTFL